MTKKQRTEAAFAGRRIKAFKMDPETGELEEVVVKVRHLPIRLLEEFYLLQMEGKKQELAAMLIGEDVEAMDLFTDESIDEIVEIGEEPGLLKEGDPGNFQRMVDHMNGKKDRFDRVQGLVEPIIQKVADQTLAMMVKALEEKAAQLQTSSPKGAGSSNAAEKSSSTKPSPG